MAEFEKLVDDYYADLYRFALSLAKNRDNASDLVQQTFCIWAEKGDQLRDRSKAKTWLFTTLYREFLAYIRHRNRFDDGESTLEKLENQSEGSYDPNRELDGNQAVELLGQLDEIYRAPLTLFYLQQHSYKEIAEILEIPIGTVMSRISRAKEMLRKKMNREPASAPKNILRLNPDKLKKNHG